MKRLLKYALMRTKRWLTEEPAKADVPVPFDNSYG
jgi:hypothetical protein